MTKDLALKGCRIIAVSFCIALIIFECFTFKPNLLDFLIIIASVTIVLCIRNESPLYQRIAFTFAILSLLLSLNMLLQWFLPAQDVFSEKYSILVSLNFSFLSIALILLAFKKINTLFHCAVIFLLITSLFSLLGYVFEVDASYQLVSLTRMDIDLSVVFIILSAAIFLITPQTGFIAMILEDSARGFMIRRVPLVIFIFATILAVLTNKGQHIPLYDDAFGDLVMLLGTIALLILSLWMTGSMLSQQEKKYLSTLQFTEQQTSTQHEIVSLMNSEQSFAMIAPQVLQVICESLDWDIGEIWEANKIEKTLYRKEIFYKKEVDPQLKEQVKDNAKIHYGSGVLGMVWKSKKSLWTRELLSKSAHAATEELLNHLHTIVAVPILYKNNVLGIVSFYTRDVKNKDANMLAILEVMGIQMGECMMHQMSKKQAYQLEEQDVLTGLVNRPSFERKLDEKLKAHSACAVLMFDLDKLQDIIAAMGYEVGNELQKTIAQMIGQVFPKEDTLARFSDGKFVLVSEKACTQTQASEYAYKIISAFKDVFYVQGKELLVTPSIGIGLFPKDAENAKELLLNAERALASAKAQGGNNFQFFTEKLIPLLADRFVLENELRHAIAENQFLLYYQPKVDLKTGLVSSAESLIRWQHPEKGLLQPGSFMPLAEENGLILPITEWIIREVCSQISSGNLTIPIAINISAFHFKEEYNLAGYLQQMIKGFHVNPESIELEITESALMSDAQYVFSILANLKGMGFGLTLDDFGTKFSSLNYLKNIVASKIKIDKSFIDNIPTSREDVLILKAIMAMFHTLGKKMIAEGVENKEQLEFLIHEGCDEVQGYYFSKPVAHEVLSTLTGKKLI